LSHYPQIFKSHVVNSRINNNRIGYNFLFGDDGVKIRAWTFLIDLIVLTNRFDRNDLNFGGLPMILPTPSPDL
jgi:hypothetical protein